MFLLIENKKECGKGKLKRRGRHVTELCICKVFIRHSFCSTTPIKYYCWIWNPQDQILIRLTLVRDVAQIRKAIASGFFYHVSSLPRSGNYKTYHKPQTVCIHPGQSGSCIMSSRSPVRSTWDRSLRSIRCGSRKLLLTCTRKRRYSESFRKRCQRRLERPGADRAYTYTAFIRVNWKSHRSSPSINNNLLLCSNPVAVFERGKRRKYVRCCSFGVWNTTNNLMWSITQCKKLHLTSFALLSNASSSKRTA